MMGRDITQERQQTMRLTLGSLAGWLLAIVALTMSLVAAPIGIAQNVSGPPEPLGELNQLTRIRTHGATAATTPSSS